MLAPTIAPFLSRKKIGFFLLIGRFCNRPRRVEDVAPYKFQFSPKNQHCRGRRLDVPQRGINPARADEQCSPLHALFLGCAVFCAASRPPCCNIDSVVVHKCTRQSPCCCHSLLLAASATGGARKRPPTIAPFLSRKKTGFLLLTFLFSKEK